MDFGLGHYPAHDALRPDALARLVEERGHASLLFAEHTHMPASEIDELPRRNAHLHDLFVALTAAALATSSVRVGSGICLVVERDPIITAKAVASIDQLSGGRFDFGVGAGWVRGEMRNHGTDPTTRMRLLSERVQAIKAIWTQDEASYAGEFVQFDGVLCWPKPVQRPHPPILVAGDGPTVLDRVLAYGDAWLPSFARDAHEGDDLLVRAQELRVRADRRIDLMVVAAPADPRALERLREGGCQRAIHWLPSGGRSAIERALERWEAAIAELNGEA